MTPERLSEIADNATKAVVASCTKVAILREALEKIEKGLADTKSTPGEWRTLMRKDEAFRIAFEALAECDARDIIATAVLTDAEAAIYHGDVDGDGEL